MISLFLIIIVLVGIVYLLKEKKSEKYATIPGLKRNASEIFDVNDFSNQGLFLSDLHRRFGPIVSFWEKDKMSVSIASPELLKETRALHDLPLPINEPFRYIVGDGSLILLNGEEPKERRKLYDQFFMLKAVNTYFDIMKEIAQEFVNKWKSYTENDHIPIMETVAHLHTKSILRTSYGDYFADDEKLNTFRNYYQSALDAFGKSGGQKESSKNVGNIIRKTVQELLAARKKELENGEQSRLFIDVLLESSLTADQQESDAMTFFIGADTVSLFFIWIIYHLAEDSKMQERVYEEIQTAVGDRDIEMEDLSKFKYLRQVIDETIRYHTHFHAGRIADKDMTLGKYFIPKGTHIYQQIGESLKDPAYWSHPDKFYPDHFTPENIKKRPAFAFKPFGCSGKRICPGMSYAYILMSSFLAIWIRKFKFHLVPGQKIELMKGVFKRPLEEVWFTVTPRI